MMLARNSRLSLFSIVETYEAWNFSLKLFSTRASGRRCEAITSETFLPNFWARYDVGELGTRKREKGIIKDRMLWNFFSRMWSISLWRPHDVYLDVFLHVYIHHVRAAESRELWRSRMMNNWDKSRSKRRSDADFTSSSALSQCHIDSR